MIRVLHMVPFGGGAQGGIENLIMNIYRRINKELIQFDFITYGNPSAFEDEIRSLGGVVYKLPSRRDSIFDAYVETKHFMEMYAKEYRWLHLHLCTASNILPLKLNKGISNVIIHSHLSHCSNPVSFLLHSVNRRAIIKSSNYLFACSDLAARHMFGKCYTSFEHYHFIPNAIDAELFRYNIKTRQKVRKNLLIQENEILLGYVGRFDRVKNIPELVELLVHLNKGHHKYKLLLVGDGETMPVVKKTVRSLKLNSDVILTGAQRNVTPFLQAMDIFVSMSSNEGLPVTLIEAQASGLPCIVKDIITKQVDLGNVYFMSSSATIKDWALRINRISRTDRSLAYLCIKNSVFNIEILSEKIQNFYLNNMQRDD